MPQHHSFHPRSPGRPDSLCRREPDSPSGYESAENAIQAIGNAPDGKITLKAYCDPQESIRIEIANNGPAIPPDAAGQIFVPFFTTKEEGSGIGLSLSKQIMRLSGGTLTLLPYKEKGQATVFVLVLIKNKMC